MPRKATSATKTPNLTAPIDILNNDCLIHIFEILPIKDRLNLELVCKRWLSVSSILWKSVHRLDATDAEMGFDTFKEDKVKINIRLCEKVLRRSAPHLTVVNLSGTKTTVAGTLVSTWHRCAFPHFEVYKNVHSSLKSLLLKCENLEELCLCSCIIRMNDSYLSELLRNNKKIRVLKLMGFEFRAQNSLLNLSFETLETVVLQCKIDVANFYEKISECTKLQTLGLACNPIDLKRLKHSLPRSLRQLSFDQNCNDIDLRESLENNQLMNLRVLILDHCHIMENSGLTAIPNHCKELIAVRLRHCHWVTDSEVSAIGALPELQYLDISDNDLSDEALGNLSKNLRVLVAGGNDFTEEMLSFVLEKLHKLDLLELSYSNVSRYFIKLAIKAIETRENSVPLEIGMYQTRVRRQIRTPDLLKITIDHELMIDFDIPRMAHLVDEHCEILNV